MPGIIFDLDGVLIDSEGLQYKSYMQVLARWGVQVSKDEYADYWIARGRGPEHAVATYHLPITPTEMRDLKGPVYHEILRREVTLMPGARDAVERLSADFPIALATNSCRIDVDFVMDQFDLRRFFTALIAREDYALAKPEPDAFVTAARALGLPSAECVVIEDAHKGLLSAARAGSPVIAVPNWWTRANDFSSAARILTNLDQLQPDLIHTVITEYR